MEAFSYLLYATAVFVARDNSKSSVSRTVLFIYYILAALLITIAAYPNVALNNFIYNIFFFITICVISYYFHTLLVGKAKRAILYLLVVVNLLLFLINDVIYQQYDQYNPYVYSISYLSIIVYALLYFHQLMTNVDEKNLLYRFDLWVVSAYLLYFLSSFYIILIYGEVEVSRHALIWSAQNIILFLSSAITLIGSSWIYYQKKYS